MDILERLEKRNAPFGYLALFGDAHAAIKELRAALSEAISYADLALHPTNQYCDARPRLIRLLGPDNAQER